MAIPANNPKILYNAVTLWLPRRFKKWKAIPTDSPAITKGNTYIQRASYPVRWKIDGTTPFFFGEATSGIDYEDWDGTGAGDFNTAWGLFWDWARLGKVFSVWKHADGGTGERNYFQYCVLTSKDDGLTYDVGLNRHSLKLACETEVAAR